MLPQHSIILKEHPYEKNPRRFCRIVLVHGFSPLHIHAEYSEQLSSEEKSELPSFVQEDESAEDDPEVQFYLIDLTDDCGLIHWEAPVLIVPLLPDGSAEDSPSPL